MSSRPGFSEQPEPGIRQSRMTLERTRRHLAAMRRIVLPDTPDQPRTIPYLTRLAVRSRERVSLLRMGDVDWLESAGNYVRLHIGRGSHLYRESLISFEGRLDPASFVRIHRATIVNIDRIAHLEPSFGRQYLVILRDGTRLTLTPPYRPRFETIVGPF